MHVLNSGLNATMTDKAFLDWLYTRLNRFHNESVGSDFMRRFRNIINAMDDNHTTPGIK